MLPGLPQCLVTVQVVCCLFAFDTVVVRFLKVDARLLELALGVIPLGSPKIMVVVLPAPLPALHIWQARQATGLEVEELPLGVLQLD